MDPTVKKGELPRFLKMVDAGKPLYVVVSHHHKDHFTKEIFDWVNYHPDIRYVISEDTAKRIRHILKSDSLYKGNKPNENKVAILKPGDRYSDSLVKITAFGSTDIGNSYLMESEGKKFFHAGDLNAWTWVEESTSEEVEEAISSYEKILNEIALNSSEMDYVMFPVDARIGSGFYTGAKMLSGKIKVKRFFPMHFCLGENENEATAFRLAAADFENYMRKGFGEYIALLSPYSRYATSED
ncbi:MAG: MBL fold metallo-hydrolase, partial [Muribaculaceae bacterium]|nr:MBL fold metallo-hydrolase [Muribaculaceae bacterium]